METVEYLLKTIKNEKKLTISKVTHVKVSSKNFIYFDKLEDGTWRMVYTNDELKTYA